MKRIVPIESKQLNIVLNVVIVLSVLLIGIFAYSTWVDRPARIREFTEVGIPDKMESVALHIN